MSVTYQLTNCSSILRSDGVSIPADPANADYAGYMAWVADGNLPSPACQPSMPELIGQAQDAIQSMLDEVAESWQYDSILSAATYANSSVQKFKAEADALIAWRDSVWSLAYNSLAKVRAGTHQFTSIDDFIRTLPAAPVRPVI